MTFDDTITIASCLNTLAILSTSGTTGTEIMEVVVGTMGGILALVVFLSIVIPRFLVRYGISVFQFPHHHTYSREFLSLIFFNYA
jgi:hypothetical protein